MDLPSAYRSFLVRLWRDLPDGAWRGEVESIQSGELVHIGSLEEIIETIRQAAGISPPPMNCNNRALIAKKRRSEY